MSSVKPVKLLDHLLDPVFFDPLLQAVSLIPCGHTVNDRTARLLQEKGALCPIDRQPFTGWTNNYAFRHIVEDALNPTAGAAAEIGRSALQPQAQAEHLPPGAAALFEQGKTALAEGRKEEAIKTFLEVLDLQPGFEKAQAYLDIALGSSAQSTTSKPSAPPMNQDSSDQSFLTPQKKPSAPPQEEKTGPSTRHNVDPKGGAAQAHLSSRSEIKLDPLEQAVRDGELIDAVSRGDIPAVRASIAAGANVNAKDKDRCTPLIVATRKGYIAIVALLIQAKADLNYSNIEDLPPSEKGQTEEGDRKEIKFFNKNMVGHALFIAIKTGQLEIAKLLLNSGADPSIGAAWGIHFSSHTYYPFDTFSFSLAVKNRSVAAVQMFLTAGASADTVIFSAINVGDPEILALLLSTLSPTQKSEAFSAYSIRMASENREIFAMVLQAGADVNRPSETDDTRGQTALHMAVENPANGNIEKLIAAGANVNAVDEKGNTPLHMATKKAKNIKTIKLLIQSGANPTLINNEGHTPYLCALQKYKESNQWAKPDFVEAMQTLTPRGNTASCIIS